MKTELLFLFFQKINTRKTKNDFILLSFFPLSKELGELSNGHLNIYVIYIIMAITSNILNLKIQMLKLLFPTFLRTFLYLEMKAKSSQVVLCPFIEMDPWFRNFFLRTKGHLCNISIGVFSLHKSRRQRDPDFPSPHYTGAPALTDLQ